MARISVKGWKSGAQNSRNCTSDGSSEQKENRNSARETENHTNSSPVPRRCNEVQAAVNPVVGHLPPVNTRLCIQEILELAVDVIDDGLPATAGETGASPVTLAQRRDEFQASLLCIGSTHQSLLSTASPNPGVSTMVSSSCTPPSFISTFDCSTCDTQSVYGFTRHPSKSRKRSTCCQEHRPGI